MLDWADKHSDQNSNLQTDLSMAIDYWTIPFDFRHFSPKVDFLKQSIQISFAAAESRLKHKTESFLSIKMKYLCKKLVRAGHLDSDDVDPTQMNTFL